MESTTNQDTLTGPRVAGLEALIKGSIINVMAGILASSFYFPPQKTLDAYTETVAKSGYGCLTINGRVCVATEKW